MEIVKEIIPKEKRDELRFNDGSVDAKGRFWLAEIDKKAMIYGPNQVPASYGPPKGRLWRYDPDGSLHKMLDGGVVCGNGLGFSPDNKTCKSSLESKRGTSILTIQQSTSMTRWPWSCMHSTLTWRVAAFQTNGF